jgi:hypothetical protein
MRENEFQIDTRMTEESLRITPESPDNCRELLFKYFKDEQCLEITADEDLEHLDAFHEIGFRLSKSEAEELMAWLWGCILR